MLLTQGQHAGRAEIAAICLVCSSFTPVQRVHAVSGLCAYSHLPTVSPGLFGHRRVPVSTPRSPGCSPRGGTRLCVSIVSFTCDARPVRWPSGQHPPARRVPRALPHSAQVRLRTCTDRLTVHSNTISHAARCVSASCTARGLSSASACCTPHCLPPPPGLARQHSKYLEYYYACAHRGARDCVPCDPGRLHAFERVGHQVT